jgi:ribosome-binding factor A
MHLLVRLCPSASATEVDSNQVLEHLHRAQARLRREVAAAIHRKRVPELTFCVVGATDKY